MSVVELIHSTPVALAVGHINHAAALYSAFVVDAEKSGLTQVQSIKEIALTSAITCVEFAKACKESQAIADNVDKGNGFVKPEGAKGQDAYGPKRRLLNQRLSEAKQLFGVFKLAPEQLHINGELMGYWGALGKSREYLASKGIKWDNTPALDAEQKQAKHASQVRTTARALAMDTHPQLKDETDEAYLMRIRDLMAEAVLAAEVEEFNKGVKTLFDSLTKKHTQETLYSVMQMMLKEMDDDGLNATQMWIQEEIVFRTKPE